MTQIIRYASACLRISIHIPRVGDDFAEDESLALDERFQSTSPAWGMTPDVDAPVAAESDFNPHPPRGG